MEFSESKQAWSPLPRWVRFLIDLGYNWPSGEPQPRRIVLLSMPCDSAGAGLVALGAIIRDLTSPNANDVDGHYNALRRYAYQYLTSCRPCDTRCYPQSKGCGYTSEASGRVRYKGKKIWEVADKTNLADGSIWFYRDPKQWQWLNPKYATEWQLDGEPPPQLINQSKALSEQAYDSIVDGASIVYNNLQRSFSALCLAGRIAGKTASQTAYSSIRFRVREVEYGLQDLLTVHGWNKDSEVSRITFFNPRTQQLDRSAYAPALVVADGDASFLRVLDYPEFQRSDIIGVINRAIERDNLEAVGNRMLGLRQWYSEDIELLDRLPIAPKGINVAIIRRRAPR